MWTDDELKLAHLEAKMVQQAIDEARNRALLPMSTPESIAAGDAAMVNARALAAETLARRIENKELLSAAELQHSLGVSQAAIDESVATNRLFAVNGPSGQPYYPAFYADADMDRTAFGLVAQELRGLPATSTYLFFVSKRTSLGETPLEALKRGRVDEVVQAAVGFATN